jgi:5'-nucleotidase
MNILVSNDDGVQAQGLEILASALQSLGKVTVVAPDRNRSGASNSLTLQNPLRVTQTRDGFYSVVGTPTDCVHLAIAGLFPQKPDLVVSGINAGGNLGDDVFYSGTVAAAMEGRFMGIPSMAISLVENHENYHTAAACAKIIAMYLMENPLPNRTILNINVPDLPIHLISGFKITRLGTRHRSEKMLAELDPRGNPIYWVGLPGPEEDSGEGTDFHAIRNNAVSITPLQLDLTHYRVFDELSHWTTALEL